jgi:hypothetical protein
MSQKPAETELLVESNLTKLAIYIQYKLTYKTD